MLGRACHAALFSAAEPCRGCPLAGGDACFELLKSAFQASPADTTVRIRTFDEPGCVSVEILDEGSGFPRELRPRVGEAFFTSREIGTGSGLGLAVASGIVRQMGGGLELQPRAGRGTSTVFTLPAARG